MGRVASAIALSCIVAMVGFLLIYHPGTGTGQTPNTQNQLKEIDTSAPEEAEAAPPKEAEKYAMDWDAKVEPVAFDAKRAMGYLEDICKIGARMSGTDGMKKQQELMEKHFKDLDGKVTYQKFTATQRSVRKPTEMANMIVSWKPDEKKRIILCSHYDTRPIADRDPVLKNHEKPFISANDGGSGVALLMELANHMKKLPLNVGVDFVFFDGEEYVFDDKDAYFFGSIHFADDYRKTRKQTEIAYHGAVLLDMVGGKNLRLPVEQNSSWRAPRLVEDVYKVAASLRANAFKPDEQSKFAVEDDHLALNRNGIPAIDLIDFDYKHWHCITDTPENCSGESMEQVARVLSVWMQRVK